MRRSFLLCLAFVLTGAVLGGCLPTVQNREGMRLNSYVGEPIDAMVRDMGTPSHSGRGPDGGWIYIWRGCRVEPDWYGRDWSRYCEITALSDSKGVMTHWSWWGNECPLRGVSSGCGGMFWWQP